MKPSKHIKKLYKKFCQEHEKIMIELLAAAYKEGFRDGARSFPIDFKKVIDKSL